MPDVYESLAPDPLPPGPRVTNPLAPLLRLLLRVFNVALAAASLLLIGWALWMGQQYRRSGDDPSGGGGGDVPSPAPFPSPEPGPSPEPSPASSPVASPFALPAGAWAALPLQLVLSLAGQAGGGGAVAAFPWFIYAVGGTGAYCFATALTGLAGVKRDRRLQLGFYILLLAVLMLAEAGATLLLLTDNAWRQRIPDDPSGRWQDAQDFVAANARGCRLAAVGLLGAELAALAAACWLHAIYTSAFERWIDDREEQAERAREVVQRAVVNTYTGVGAPGRDWNTRLRSKYGVEASALEAATNAARQTAALQADPI